MSEIGPDVRVGCGSWADPKNPSPPRRAGPSSSAANTVGAGRCGTNQDGHGRSFHSILYENPDDAAHPPRDAPDYFRDLNLDQVVDAITVHKAGYDLKPFFYDVLTTADAVSYRHEVMRDLEDDRTLQCLNAFARQMDAMREQMALAGKLYYVLQKQRWFLEAASTYCAAIRDLKSGLCDRPLGSRGLLAFRAYLVAYASSGRFSALDAAVAKLNADLETIEYCVLIRGGAFRVRRYESEPDYSAEILDTFRKFQQGAAEERRATFNEPKEMNHVEAKVLEFVARLYPDIFARVEAFCAQNQDFTDPTVTRFDRESQFYVSYKEFMAALERAGLSFCYPEVSAEDKAVLAEDGFDLALAVKLVQEGKPVVCNDFRLTGPERILVVSGPNQGGKTTFARMFGQMHHLVSIGCPVPGRRATLFLSDRLFAHFEREENLKNLRGKLQDDLVRIYDILRRATPRSVIVMNEIFTSTTLSDAVFLARKVIDAVIELDCLCVCVTFLHELSSLNQKTVSVVSTVVPDDPATRTFRIVRRPADGRSYALSVAEKHRVTYEDLKARIPS